MANIENLIKTLKIEEFEDEKALFFGNNGEGLEVIFEAESEIEKQEATYWTPAFTDVKNKITITEIMEFNEDGEDVDFINIEELSDGALNALESRIDEKLTKELEAA